MSRNLVALIALVLLMPAFVLGAGPMKAPMKNLPVVAPDAINLSLPVTAPSYPLVETDGIDLVGDTVMIGNTWYENQHNGTCGRMVAVDNEGYRHIAWMKGYESGATNRHVWYNIIAPNSMTKQWPEGIVVDASIRSGFTNLDVDSEGRAFVAMHHQITSGVNQTAVYADILPRAGAFVPNSAEVWPGSTNAMIWPRITLMTDTTMLLLGTESVPAGVVVQNQTWLTGDFDAMSGQITFTPWTALEQTTTIAGDLASSPVSNRVAAAWTQFRDLPDSANQYNNDIHMMIDNDGQNLNFDNWFNLTKFIDVDLSFFPDTLLMDRDTLRAYTDLSLFFDNDDYCHVTFTTPGYYALENTISIAPAIIWEWSEEFPNEFHMIANHWYAVAAYPPGCGAWNRVVQRSELGQDPSTGYLYCMYQVYDSLGISSAGLPSGEIYLSVSTDRGRNWSEGINITNTHSPEGALPGQSLSELTPSMAQKVDGYCHIVYTLDRDAGNILQTEGTWTNNPYIYHRVPVEAVPATPLVPQWPAPGGVPFHVDTVDVVMPGGNFTPTEFGLEQNSPNPFNPTTSIRFSLASTSTVDLAVYNLSGAKVATLAAGTYAAGSHVVTFDASNLASGVYLYKLQANGQTLSRKMALVK